MIYGHVTMPRRQAADSFTSDRPLIALTGLAIVAVYGIIGAMTAGVVAYNPFYVPIALVLLALVPLDQLRLPAPKLLPCNRRQAIHDLTLLAKAIVALLPATFLVVGIMTWAGITLPLAGPAMTREQLAGWLIFQLLYVAVPEELFFRGFVQRSMETIVGVRTGNSRLAGAYSIVAASLVFAFAHVLFTASATAIFVLVPSIIFGWMYHKTRSLAAPIAAHFIANSIYVGMLHFM